MKPSLELLFPSLGQRRFLTEYWPDRCLVEHGPADRLGALVETAETRTIPAIIHANRGRTRAQLQTPSGRYDHVSVSPEEAQVCFEHGMPLHLEHVEFWLNPVLSYLQSITQSVGIPSDLSFCSAFVTPKGYGTPKHFDSKELIAIHLLGRKKWTIARNTDVPYPAVNYSPPICPTAEQVMPPNGPSTQLASSPDMPCDSQVIDMLPGSVLFLPRGYWHQTHALEDSLSLSLGFAIPTWLDIFMEHLSGRLLEKPHWRAPGLIWSDNSPIVISSTHKEIANLVEECIGRGSTIDGVGDLIKDRVHQVETRSSFHSV